MGAQIYPSTLLDVFIVLSFSGDTPSTLWTLASLRPCRTLVYIRPPCGSGLYPSIPDLKFSSSWDDPSTLWTLFYIRPCWTSNSHPLGMTRPLCGLVLYPSILDFKFSSSWDDLSTLWTLCNLSIHNKNPCGKSKLYLNILLKEKCICRKKYLPPWA